MKSKYPVVIMLGPSRSTVSGVSTHLNLLFASNLAHEFALIHFQVGSEGREESASGRWLRLMWSPLALAARILIDGADIVHLNTSLNHRAYWRDLAYLLVAKLCGARTVYQVHGGELPREFTLGSRLRAAVLPAALRLPDTIVVLADSELEAYRNFVPEQHIVLLPNAIDLAAYDAPVRSHADPSLCLRLLYVGRLVRSKGLYEVLSALADARASGISAKLVVAGSGPDEASMKAATVQLGLEQAVLFAGPVFDEDKLALYGEADVLMFPTYHPEGLPYVLLECMAAGVPAITTRVGAMPDVMVDGVHGLFVPPRDKEAITAAIAKLATNRDLLAEMSVACRRRIAHSYSIERLAGHLGRLYRELLAMRRTGMPRTQPGTLREAGKE